MLSAFFALSRLPKMRRIMFRFGQCWFYLSKLKSERNSPVMDSTEKADHIIRMCQDWDCFKNLYKLKYDLQRINLKFKDDFQVDLLLSCFVGHLVYLLSCQVSIYKHTPLLHFMHVIADRGR